MSSSYRKPCDSRWCHLAIIRVTAATAFTRELLATTDTTVLQNWIKRDDKRRTAAEATVKAALSRSLELRNQRTLRFLSHTPAAIVLSNLIIVLIRRVYRPCIIIMAYSTLLNSSILFPIVIKKRRGYTYLSCALKRSNTFEEIFQR